MNAVQNSQRMRLPPAPRLIRGSRGGFLVRHPQYADLLDRLELTACADYFSLSEEIISGHPDRHVSRVLLDDGDNAVSAYLKREHVVPWKERLVNWQAGFGWASKSWREAQTLALLDQTAVVHPQWIASGEDDHGRAFLLLRALDDAIPLSECLRQGSDCARAVGWALAELHREGFDHPDLYAGHVLIQHATGRVLFIDWQRARRHLRLSSRLRWRAVAALRATLPEEVAGAHWWRICLSACLLRFNPHNETLPEVVALVESEADSLRRRRHVRSKRGQTIQRSLQKPHPNPSPEGEGPVFHPSPSREGPEEGLFATEPHPTLVLLDQGRLWMTPEGRRLWPDQPPVSEWLQQHGRRNVNLPNGESGLLTVQCHRPYWWQRRPWTSPERRTMSLLFRLEKLGIEAPHVLAVGEYPRPDGDMDAFLLTRLPRGCAALPVPCPPAEALLRQLAQAGFDLPGGLRALAWQTASARPVVFDVAGLRLRSGRWLSRLCSPLRVAFS